MKTASRLALVGLAALTLGRGQGVISTVAGNGMTAFSGDGGPATSAALSIAPDMAVDSAGNVYIADRGNNRIRKVTPAGVISTFAGTGKEDFSGDGGPATSAALISPASVALDSAGNVYFVDAGNNRIRKVNTAGMISTVAGGGRQSGDGGLATSILLLPDTVAVDSAGNLYISDNGTRIRKVNKEGIISTVAGGAIGFSGDGGPANRAAMTFPSGMAIDPVGNLYIADKGNNRIRKVNTAGVISTVAALVSRASRVMAARQPALD